MKKSELRQLIREEIKKSYVNEGMMDKLGKFIYKANALVFPKMTAGKFHLLFMKHKLDIRRPEVKAYIEKTLPTQRVKDEFYALMKGHTKESVNEGFTKKDWDVKWKMPKDNLFNATKTKNAVDNRYKALQNLLKDKPKELKAFDATDDHPAYDMSYDELMKWYNNLSESVNEGLPPGYAKFLVSLQTLIGDIAPNAWGNKSQISPSSVKRVHNSLKKRYGTDYAKFNDLLKTQKGQFGNWYLNESVNEGTCGYDTDARTEKKFKTPGGL